MINVDFADVRSVMADAGMGVVTIGRASGADRAIQAAEAALASPLLDIELRAVTGAPPDKVRSDAPWILNIVGGADGGAAAAGSAKKAQMPATTAAWTIVMEGGHLRIIFYYSFFFTFERSSIFLISIF